MRCLTIISCARDTANLRNIKWNTEQNSDEHENRSGEDDVEELDDKVCHLTLAVRSVQYY